jgi:ribosome-associated translation inhibitor RaiA
MPLETKLEIRGLALAATEQRRIEQHLRSLERRLVKRPDPTAVLVLRDFAMQRRVEADLRVQLGPLGGHLVSHQSAESPDQAVRLAVEDVQRQLERQTARQRGEPTFGVPSRRLPKALRPNPYTPPAPEEPEEEVADKPPT